MYPIEKHLAEMDRVYNDYEYVETFSYNKEQYVGDQYNVLLKGTDTPRSFQRLISTDGVKVEWLTAEWSMCIKLHVDPHCSFRIGSIE